MEIDHRWGVIDVGKQRIIGNQDDVQEDLHLKLERTNVIESISSNLNCAIELDFM